MSECYIKDCPFRISYFPTSVTRCDAVGCNQRKDNSYNGIWYSTDTDYNDYKEGDKNG